MSAMELSRPLRITPDMGAGADARPFEIEASAAERAALAKRFGLLSLDRLSATGTVEVYERGRRARVSGGFSADVVQACVVTLGPVPAHVEERFVRSFDREAGPADGEEVEIEIGGEDPPDPLPEAGIDLGELVAEQLGLALDPYPRAADAEWPADGAGPEPRETPFSVLKRLQRR